MYHTTYARAATLSDAKSRLGAASDGKYLAGGQTLLPTMKARLAAPSDLIDLTHLSEISGIAVADGVVTIGAAVRHAEVAASAEVRAAIPALAELAGHIGDPAVRNRGTLGGSLANNDPAADYPAAALGLAATIVTDRREIPADEYFEGMFTTALEEDEIVTAVRFPVPLKAAYEKFPNPASRYAMVGVFAALTEAGPRVAVTGAGSDGVFRHAAIEAALADGWSGDAVQSAVTDPSEMVSDIHASATYRAHLTNVIARRAIDKAT